MADVVRNITAFIAGLIFGLGLGVSQMVNPSKVLNFLDVAGTWDPSLMFVMGGAVIITAISFRIVSRLSKPLFGGQFELPTKHTIDIQLIGGAALFGVGWGMVGFCPGPAVSSFSYLIPESLIFVASLIAGASVVRLLSRFTAVDDEPKVKI